MGFGRVLFVVSKGEGTLLEVNHKYIQEIETMPSYLYLEIFHAPGKVIKKTIDCFTWAGLVTLFNENENQLTRDYDRIREMEDTGLFIVS